MLESKECKWQESSDGFWVCIKADRRAALEEISKLKPGKTYSVEIKEKRRKRSLDANAYYWLLLGKVSAAVEISTNRCHNLMLRRYGKPMIIDGQIAYVVIPDTDEAEETALEAETYHVKPTSNVRPGADGVDRRTYIMLRGSSTYDTAEMSDLINGLVGECKGIGIETLTPEELERMGINGQ